jgi:L-alanine-DL-glutamate epimerase-like enolase superfamily enzyme
MERHDLYFAEAPCQPEDIEGQMQVARASACRWRSARSGARRTSTGRASGKRCMGIVQPEMGHTGVTEFMKIARMARIFHARSSRMPRSASASSWPRACTPPRRCQYVPYHEYQHSIFDRNLAFTTGDMACEAGQYTVPTGPGIGVEPTDALFDHVVAA